MKRFVTLMFALLAVLTAFLGCSRIVTGGYTDSADGKYRCWFREFGPYNYSIINRWTNRIRIVEVLGDKTHWEEKTLFTKEYHCKHPYMMIEALWDKEDNVKIIVYEYGHGVAWEAARKAGSPSNFIASVSLILDKQTGKFHEKK
jgi:hypothetical protein